MAKIANNLSAIAEHYQKTSHQPLRFFAEKITDTVSQDDIFIRKVTSPSLNRDRGGGGR